MKEKQSVYTQGGFIYEIVYQGCAAPDLDLEGYILVDATVI